MKNPNHISVTFFFLFVWFLPSINSLARECDELYHRGDMIGEGINKIVYLLEPQKPDGSCWDAKHCANMVVKEYRSNPGQQSIYAESESRRLGVAVPQFAAGSCERDQQPIFYEIEQRLFTLTKTMVREKPRFYAGKIQRRLDLLHKNNILHGDMHIGNVLVSEDGNDVFLGDFDHGVDLSKKDNRSREGDIAFENFLASKIWIEELPWQPLMYRYKIFDTQKKGAIEGQQLEKLSMALGNWDLAVATSYIYAFEFSLHDNIDFRTGFFLDLNNDGLVDLKDIKKEELVGRLEGVAQKYADYVQSNMKDPYLIVPADRDLGKRVLSTTAPHSRTFPLLAKDILIISGGDINENRSFPSLTQENFTRFAGKHGYRAEFFKGNLIRQYPYWHKIMMLIDKLNDSKNKVVVWLDDDGIVNTDSDMVERYLTTYPKSDLIVARDPEDFAYVNSGFLIFRNTVRSMQLLHGLLEIGAEGRIDQNTSAPNWFPKNHLFQCKQDYHCLHEQQALQELIQAKKRVYNNKVVDRERFIEWTNSVSVVPQIDTRNGLNANLLLMDGSETVLSGVDQNGHKAFFDDRNLIYSLIAKNAKDRLPFFVQCAGLYQDKTKCVQNIARYESGAYENALKELPPGDFANTCTACEIEGDYLVCQCLNNNKKWIHSAVNANCSSRIDNKNGNLFCKNTQAVKPCSAIYSKTSRNDVGNKHVDGSCFEPSCHDAVVKEFPEDEAKITDRRAFDRLQSLGILPPVFESGDCSIENPQTSDMNVVHYRIEKKLNPLRSIANPTKMSNVRERVKEMVKKAHGMQIALGNLVQDDVLVDGDLIPYFANYRRARVLSDTGAKRAKIFAKEDFAASKITTEVHEWQPFFYKYKALDADGSGEIQGDEFEVLKGITSSQEEAEVIAYLYADSYKKSKVIPAVFLDENNSGILEEITSQSWISRFQENVLSIFAKLPGLGAAEVNAQAKKEYENLVATWKKNYFLFNPSVSSGQRLVSHDFPYDTNALRAVDILIISGGDVTAKRNFPLLSRENFRQFAENRGYRFQHYGANLAAPKLGYWHKIAMLVDKLADPRNRVVVWLDDDGAVNLKSNMIERYLQTYPSKDVIVAKDPEEFAYVNTGALIMRNTPRSFLLLKRILEVGYSDNARLMTCSQNVGCLHEQQSLQELLGGKWDHRNWYDIVEVVPQIDSVKGLNMNFLLKDGLYSPLVGQGISSRREMYPVPKYPDFVRERAQEGGQSPQSIEFPFFVQCADARQDKFICLSGIMEIQEKGFTERVLNLPKGSYRNTCKCLVDANTLKCDCEGKQAQIALPCQNGEIESEGGTLHCRQRDRLPAGAYAKTCDSCFLESGNLHCRCEAPYGGRSDSQLKIPCPQEEEINNYQGKLTCTDIRKPLPKGTYSETCGKCEYTKDTLRCSCPNPTSLKVPCASSELDIGALNGKLTCMAPRKKLPAGSYSSSDCKKCEYREDTLKCECTDNKVQELKLPCSAGKDIGFFQKKLVCTEPIKPLPKGGYEGTCGHCQYRGNILSCECKNTNYGRVDTNLSLPCGEYQSIENDKGRLTCTDIVREIPQGKYLQDCNECSFKGTTLKCRCQNMLHSLQLPCPEGKEILYRDAKLQCFEPSKPLPAGAYTNTCKKCYFDGSTLDCDCLDLYHNHKHSSVKFPCKEHQNLDNVDGRLTCKDVQFPLPKGDYSKICSECAYLGTTLKCVCKGARASLGLPCPKGEEVWYRNAKLQCSAPSQELPQGGYPSTCIGCYNDGTTLECQCLNRERNYQKTTLALPCAKVIQNEGGTLKCAK